MSKPQKHAIITCYDERLSPCIEIFKQRLIQKGHIVLAPIRPVGGVHALTRRVCRESFYDQVDGLVQIGKATHIHLFPHTNCQYGWLKVRDKVGTTPEQDLEFQIKILRNSCDGARRHLKEKYPDRVVHVGGKIILTREHRMITPDMAMTRIATLHHKEHSHRPETPTDPCLTDCLVSSVDLKVA